VLHGHAVGLTAMIGSGRNALGSRQWNMEGSDAIMLDQAKPDILFVSGSPRAHTCEHLAGIIETGARDAGALTQRFMLSSKHVKPCTGCGSCSKTGICVLASSTEGGKFIDDYLEFKAVLDRTDALALIAPLYFAGPPAQLKALLDRLQPYWASRYVLGEPPRTKRPAQLFIVGAGGDAHGFDPLVGIVKSALAVAGFTVEKVHSFVGFKAPQDAPVMPSAEQRDALALGELAVLRRAIAAQEDFVQRAHDAGGALARFVAKTHERLRLASELKAVEAELEAIAEDGKTQGEGGGGEGVGAVPASGAETAEQSCSGGALSEAALPGAAPSADVVGVAGGEGVGAVHASGAETAAQPCSGGGPVEPALPGAAPSAGAAGAGGAGDVPGEDAQKAAGAGAEGAGGGSVVQGEDAIQDAALTGAALPGAALPDAAAALPGAVLPDAAAAHSGAVLTDAAAAEDVDARFNAMKAKLSGNNPAGGGHGHEAG
jgi:multimeric flavodoxin WrbA